MRHHQATLIQDVREYHQLLRPFLHQCIQIYWCVNEMALLKWIIEEEIELIYGLYTVEHNDKYERNYQPYVQIHNWLSTQLPFNLSVMTAAYIKAPKLYNYDYPVVISIRGTDLWIEYSGPPLPNPFPDKHGQYSSH